MRPNNVIALERAKTESLLKESKQKKKDDVCISQLDSRHDTNNALSIE